MMIESDSLSRRLKEGRLNKGFTKNDNNPHHK
jgi:hypothetical protein